MNAFPPCRSPDGSTALHDDVSDESRAPRIPPSLTCPNSSPQSTTSSSQSFTPISTFRSSKDVDEEVRELAKVLRRMQAADKRYWEESKFLLLRNEVAIQTLFQGNLATVRQKKEDAKEVAEPKAVRSTFFQERKSTDEEERVKEQRNSIADVEVDHKAAVERLSGGVNAQRAEHYQTTPFHIQVLEDRINKARSDLSILEEHSRYVETEMKMLQAEHVKLNDQRRRAEVQFDGLLQEQQTYLTESFKLYHRELLNRESFAQDLEAIKIDESATQEIIRNGIRNQWQDIQTRHSALISSEDEAIFGSSQCDAGPVECM